MAGAFDHRRGVREPTEEQTLSRRPSQDEYARWLFEFLRSDLADLTPGQQDGMRTDAREFAVPAHALPAHDEGRLDSEGRPTIEALRSLQTETRDAIQRVRSGAWFEPPSLLWGIRLVGSRIVRRYRSRDFRGRFLTAVADVLQANWERVRVCPTCRALFMKKGKQKFCSPTCGNRAHWAAFVKRGRPARDYQREHETRTRRRLGSTKVKTAKRGRRR